MSRIGACNVLKNFQPVSGHQNVPFRDFRFFCVGNLSTDTGARARTHTYTHTHTRTRETLIHEASYRGLNCRRVLCLSSPSRLPLHRLATSLLVWERDTWGCFDSSLPLSLGGLSNFASLETLFRKLAILIYQKSAWDAKLSHFQKFWNCPYNDVLARWSWASSTQLFVHTLCNPIF